MPPLSLSGNQSHTPSALPTFSNIASGGFSPSLSFLGYAFFLGEPGVRYWQHFLSAGALGSATGYYVDVEQAPGLAGVVPTPGSSVQLRATAFAGDQPLSTLSPPGPSQRRPFPDTPSSWTGCGPCASRPPSYRAPSPGSKGFLSKNSPPTGPFSGEIKGQALGTNPEGLVPLTLVGGVGLEPTTSRV